MTVDTADTTRFLVACSHCKRQFDAKGLASKSRFHCSCGETIEVPRFTPHAAAVVRCSSCSAPRTQGSSACRHCGADYTLHEQDLHTVCASCMTRVSDRARFCHHCATPIAPQGEAGARTDLLCPTCRRRTRLNSRSLGEPPIALLECPGCAGLWVSHEVFRLVADRARDQTLPEETLPGAVGAAGVGADRQKGSMYRRCPQCRKHMNRRNFGRRSGVILDACKDHGFWFDTQELDAILRWIRKGGEQQTSRRDQEEQRSGARRARIQVIREERLGMANTPEQSGYGKIGGLIETLFDRLFDL